MKISKSICDSLLMNKSLWLQAFAKSSAAHINFLFICTYAVSNASYQLADNWDISLVDEKRNVIGLCAFFLLQLSCDIIFSMFSSFYNALNCSLQSRQFICQFVLSVIYIYSTLYLWHAIKFNNSLLMAMLYVSLFQAKNHSTNRIIWRMNERMKSEGNKIKGINPVKKRE